MNKTPFKPSHPTLKACKCGYVGSRSQLYKHFDYFHRKLAVEVATGRSHQTLNQLFFATHGEVPLNEDDPKLLQYYQLITN